MPPHAVYVEPFLGAGSVMRHKRPAASNIGLDLDPAAPGLAWFPGDSKFDLRAGDGIEFLRSHRFGPSDLVYCDPPYMHQTRGRSDIYRFELSDRQHVELLEVIRRLPCRVMISGYWTRLYARKLAGWNVETFEAMTRAGRTATEWLWFNFERPVELHDYRYLGSNFRERERIKRKKQRWVRRLKSMPNLERQALLAAISEAHSSGGVHPSVAST